MENPSLINVYSSAAGYCPQSSITLRDLFAGLAMQASITRFGLCVIERFDGQAVPMSEQLAELASSSYMIADAMLEEREGCADA